MKFFLPEILANGNTIFGSVTERQSAAGYTMAKLAVTTARWHDGPSIPGLAHGDGFALGYPSTMFRWTIRQGLILSVDVETLLDSCTKLVDDHLLYDGEECTATRLASGELSEPDQDGVARSIIGRLSAVQTALGHNPSKVPSGRLYMQSGASAPDIIIVGNTLSLVSFPNDTPVMSKTVHKPATSL